MIKETFAKYDLDGDDRITKEQLKAALKDLGIKESEDDLAELA